MTGRQNGVPLTKMMEVANSDNEQANDLTRKIILAAYEQPSYSTDEIKQRTITDFANDVALVCYQALN